jgi:hypothetical protein
MDALRCGPGIRSAPGHVRIARPPAI